MVEMFAKIGADQWFRYLGSDSSDRIALANKIAGRQPTDFSTWARTNFTVQAIKSTGLRILKGDKQ